MAETANRFVGTWRLVHSISISPSGEKEYPFGSNAIGYIYYSDTGVMGVQITRPDRKPVMDPSNLVHEYLAYFGRYEVDTHREVVRHLLEGELFPGVEGEVPERRYRFDGDFMSLKPVDGTDREILWRRVPNP
jgi:Lipocalin-like domain